MRWGCTSCAARLPSTRDKRTRLELSTLSTREDVDMEATLPHFSPHTTQLMYTARMRAAERCATSSEHEQGAGGLRRLPGLGCAHGDRRRAHRHGLAELRRRPAALVVRVRACDGRPGEGVARAAYNSAAQQHEGVHRSPPRRAHHQVDVASCTSPTPVRKSVAAVSEIRTLHTATHREEEEGEGNIWYFVASGVRGR